jgi:hypothetical protein
MTKKKFNKKNRKIYKNTKRKSRKKSRKNNLKIKKKIRNMKAGSNNQNQDLIVQGVGKKTIREFKEGVLTHHDLTDKLREKESKKFTIEAIEIEDTEIKARNPGIKVIIKEGMTSIGEYAFTQCKQIIEVIIPASVTSICKYAFSRCDNLTTITLPDKLQSIEDSVFASCLKLKKIIIPENVTTIGNSAFRFCKDLHEINIPKKVTEIGENAFIMCGELKTLTFEDSETSITIGNGAFFNSSNLTEVTIIRPCTYKKWVFFNKGSTYPSFPEDCKIISK